VNFVPWINLFWAILAIAVLFLYRPAPPQKYYASHFSAKGWIIAIAQLWLCSQSIYALLKIVQTQDLNDPRQIGYLLLTTFNALVWGLFFFRNFVAYFFQHKGKRGYL